jgi:hypothetical protein
MNIQIKHRITAAGASVRVIPLTFRPDMLLANRKRWKWQTRRLVKSSNSLVPGMFEDLDLATGRSRRALPELTEIRAQCAFKGGSRVVTVSPRIIPGDLLWTRLPRGRRVDSKQTLKVQAVRGCRVQDMTEADALAEGIIAVKEYGPELGSGRARYALLWDAINGPGSWAANPWVWVYEYSVTDQNVDKLLGRS